MTPEAQRIAIAEACGWVSVRELDDLYPDGSVAAGIWWQGVNPQNGQEELLPDYINDLNAMHEAEKVLLVGYEDDPEGSVLWCDYQTNVIIGCPAYLSYHATAAQRAEAFLRTIGKWVKQ